MYYRYLESWKPSSSVMLESCSGLVNKMKFITQETDLIMSMSLLLYSHERSLEW